MSQDPKHSFSGNALGAVLRDEMPTGLAARPFGKSIDVEKMKGMRAEISEMLSHGYSYRQIVRGLGKLGIKVSLASLARFIKEENLMAGGSHYSVELRDCSDPPANNNSELPVSKANGSGASKKVSAQGYSLEPADVLKHVMDNL